MTICRDEIRRDSDILAVSSLKASRTPAARVEHRPSAAGVREPSKEAETASISESRLIFVPTNGLVMSGRRIIWIDDDVIWEKMM